MENEYLRLANRIEEVGDPNYALELTERILTIDLKIKKGNKGRKRLEVNQMHREKKMDEVIQLGEPYLQKEIDKLKIDLAVVQSKTREVDTKLDKNASKLRETNAKKNYVAGSLRELERAGNKIGAKDNAKKNVDATKKREGKLLRLKQESLMKEIKIIRTKRNITTNEFNAKINDLNSGINALSNKVQKKNGEWLEYVEELSGIAEILKEPYFEVTKASIRRWEEICRYFDAEKARLKNPTKPVSREEVKVKNNISAKEEITNEQEVKVEESKNVNLHNEIKEEVKSKEVGYKPSFALKKNRKANNSWAHSMEIENQAPPEASVDQSQEKPKRVFNLYQMAKEKPKASEEVKIKEIPKTNNNAPIKTPVELQSIEKGGVINFDREEANDIMQYLAPESGNNSPTIKKESIHNALDDLEEVLID